MNDKVDAEVWARKDDLSARQTAANVTGYVFEGKEISVEQFIEYAEKIRAWLFTNQKLSVDVTTPKIPETIVPMPTAGQQKILEFIAKELNTEINDELKIKVLDYIEKNFGKRIYPGKVETAKQFLKES